MDALLKSLLADSINAAMAARAVGRDLQRQSDNTVPGQMVSDNAERVLRNLERIGAELRKGEPDHADD